MIDAQGSASAQGTGGLRRLVEDELDASRQTAALNTDVRRLMDSLRSAKRRFSEFGDAAVSEFGRVGAAMAGLGKTIATMDLGRIATRELHASASLDRELIRAGMAHNMSREERSATRQDLWEIARSSGNNVHETASSYRALSDAGWSPKDAIRGAMAADSIATITGNSVTSSIDGLKAAKVVMDASWDLPGDIAFVAEKLVVASTAIDVSVNDLAVSLNKFGPKVIERLGIDRTLSLAAVTYSSTTDPQVRDSMLRSSASLLNSQDDLVEIARSTGVSYQEKSGARRDPLRFLNEVSAYLGKLESRKQREEAITSISSRIGPESRTFFEFAMKKNRVEELSATEAKVRTSSALASSYLAQNQESSSAVAGRVSNTVSELVDRASVPINKLLATAGKELLEMNPSGETSLGVGLAGAALGGMASLKGNAGGNAVGSLLGVSGIVANVTLGKALESSLGITPVFVTNWPQSARSGESRSPGVVMIPGGGLKRGPKGRGRGLDLGSLLMQVVMLFSRGRFSLLPMPVDENGDVVESLDFSWLGHKQEVPGAAVTGKDASRLAALPTLTSLSEAPSPAPLADPVPLDAVVTKLDAILSSLAAFVAHPLQVTVNADIPWLHAELADAARREERRN
ncbi:phage tail tape measure protein [Luteibacter yeojuensis]|uniref:Phage tail tape measure protein n=1 Tax=Luteibacter yeojuensis TaxID=345309 RepID=A0A0F3KFP6_9GAMM|nr:phage tail tape measure protein [Luteibacter yeojuensis]KJV30028.1 hypothetical protein VI08_15305 [Luteibacter yeojuensis]